MGNSKIGWTNKTWNCLHGCDRVSGGCLNCYAVPLSARMQENPDPKIQEMYHGLTMRHKNGQIDWTGQINFTARKLDEPFSWTGRQRVFVNSLSDVFHPEVQQQWIAMHWAVMALTPQHQYQILTKRPDRIRDVLGDPLFLNQVREYTWIYRDKFPKKTFSSAAAMNFIDALDPCYTPLENVWLGTSCEDQRAAEIRVPYLLDAPAAVRFISAEPLLGPIHLDALSSWQEGYGPGSLNCLTGEWWPAVGNAEEEGRTHWIGFSKIDWVIVGGESGTGARYMDWAWADAIWRQCKESDTRFFGKQAGTRLAEEYHLPGKGEGPITLAPNTPRDKEAMAWLNVQEYPATPAPAEPPTLFPEA